MLQTIQRQEEFLAMTRSGTGTEITRFNALRHGVLSRYTVLPWEDAEEYCALIEAVVAEHVPKGPTEEHLVEELAGILWRKRRLRMAEGAAYHHGLEKSFGPSTAKAAIVHLGEADNSFDVAEAVRTTAAETSDDVRDLHEDEAMTQRALRLLGSRRNDAYEAALEALREDTQNWWAEELAVDPGELDEDEEAVTPDIEGLRRFLEDKVLPWFENRKNEIANRPLIREQAFGQSLDPDRLERLGRYEVHLDRKLERTVSMLLRLKGLRRPTIPG
jgi:hypothetical protein